MITTRDLEGALARAGLPDPAAARRIVDATLAVLGERLTSDESAALAGCLAVPLREIVAASAYDADFDAAELYERIRRRSGVSASLARENAQVVMTALGRGLPDEVVRRLDHALPEELAGLLHERDVGEPPPAGAARGHTLATGRPGSRHPIAESPATRAHSHSVVREDNPHGETKLSSTRGLTQEREGESLAAGQPGPSRRISDARDD